MISRLRQRLTYANVMATLAVFIALGGSSYAAMKVTGKDVREQLAHLPGPEANTLGGSRDQGVAAGRRASRPQLAARRRTARGKFPHSVPVGQIACRRHVRRNDLPIACARTEVRLISAAIVDEEQHPGPATSDPRRADSLHSAKAEIQLAPGGELTSDVYPRRDGRRGRSVRDLGHRRESASSPTTAIPPKHSAASRTHSTDMSSLTKHLTTPEPSRSISRSTPAAPSAATSAFMAQISTDPIVPTRVKASLATALVTMSAAATPTASIAQEIDEEVEGIELPQPGQRVNPIPGASSGYSRTKAFRRPPHQAGTRTTTRTARRSASSPRSNANRSHRAEPQEAAPRRDEPATPRPRAEAPPSESRQPVGRATASRREADRTPEGRQDAQPETGGRESTRPSHRRRSRPRRKVRSATPPPARSCAQPPEAIGYRLRSTKRHRARRASPTPAGTM